MLSYLHAGHLQFRVPHTPGFHEIHRRRYGFVTVPSLICWMAVPRVRILAGLRSLWHYPCCEHLCCFGNRRTLLICAVVLPSHHLRVMDPKRTPWQTNSSRGLHHKVWHTEMPEPSCILLISWNRSRRFSSRITNAAALRHLLQPNSPSSADSNARSCQTPKYRFGSFAVIWTPIEQRYLCCIVRVPEASGSELHCAL